MTQVESIEVHFTLLIWSSEAVYTKFSYHALRSGIEILMPYSTNMLVQNDYPLTFVYLLFNTFLESWKLSSRLFNEGMHCLKCSGQQIRSKIDSFQNANFLISQPNPMMLPLQGSLLQVISMREMISYEMIPWELWNYYEIL